MIDKTDGLEITQTLKDLDSFRLWPSVESNLKHLLFTFLCHYKDMIIRKFEELPEEIEKIVEVEDCEKFLREDKF